MSVSLLWVSVIWKLFLKCCNRGLEGYSGHSAQLNREGMVRGVFFIYSVKVFEMLGLFISFSSQFGKLLRKGSVGVEGGLTSVLKMKARARGCLVNPSFLPAVFLTAPDTTGLWGLCLEPVLQHCREAVCREEMMAFLQREVFLGQHPLGCPACQKEPWSLVPEGAKQGQSPFPAGLCPG